MKIIPILACVLLVGCSAGGGDGESCLATYSYEYDQVGETGLTLLTGDYSFIPFEEMEAEYIDLERCATNTNTPGPYVQFMGFNDSLYNKWNLAIYHYAILTVFIDTDPNVAQRNCISDREFLRHEYMHHVLHLNGEDADHTNPKFAACSALGPKTCNGQYCE